MAVTVEPPPELSQRQKLDQTAKKTLHCDILRVNMNRPLGAIRYDIPSNTLSVSRI